MTLKKWLALILAGLMALSLVACGGSPKKEETAQYLYADSMELPNGTATFITGKPTGLKPFEACPQDTYDYLYAVMKGYDFLTELDGLNWATVKKTRVLFATGIEYPKDSGYEGYKPESSYYPDINAIVFFDPDLSSEVVFEDLVREFVFALFYTENFSKDPFNEAVVDYYTSQIINNLSLVMQTNWVYIARFPYQTTLLTNMMSFLGVKQTVSLLQKGKLYQTIESYSKKGMGQKFANAVFCVSHGIYKNEHQYAQMVFGVADILCHAAKNCTDLSKMSADDLTVMLTTYFHSAGLEPNNNDYFLGVLGKLSTV